MKLFRVYVNGRHHEDRIAEYGSGWKPGEYEFKVPLAEGKNVIVVTARNVTGWWSLERDGTLALVNEAGGALDRSGTLYVLAIGVSKYPKASPLYRDLSFAGKDALAFAKAMKLHLGPLHERVPLPVVLVENEDVPSEREPDVTIKSDPDRTSILNAIQHLHKPRRRIQW